MSSAYKKFGDNEKDIRFWKEVISILPECDSQVEAFVEQSIGLVEKAEKMGTGSVKYFEDRIENIAYATIFKPAVKICQKYGKDKNYLFEEWEPYYFLGGELCKAMVGGNYLGSDEGAKVSRIRTLLETIGEDFEVALDNVESD